MKWHILLTASHFTVARAFVAAPIHWGGIVSKKLFLLPGALLNDAKASVDPPQNLKIVETPGRMFDDRIPFFLLKPDKTISWETTGMCIEAGNSRIGDAIRVNTCTGGPTQLWNVLPRGHERKNLIQLKDTKLCIDVDGEGVLNGAPVVLQECAATVTELWVLEQTIPLQSQGPVQQFHIFLLRRHHVVSVLSMAALGALSLHVWLRRWLQQRDSVLSGMDCGGVPLTAGVYASPKLEASIRKLVSPAMAMSPGAVEDAFPNVGSKALESTDLGPLNRNVEIGNGWGTRQVRSISQARAHLPPIVAANHQVRTPSDPQMGMGTFGRKRGKPGRSRLQAPRMRFDGMPVSAELRPKRIILVRNGESHGNMDQSAFEVTPDSKIELTGNGFLQSTIAGMNIRDLIGDESVNFFVSPYVRTKQTLCAILRAFEGQTVNVTSEPRLREQDFGNFQDQETMVSRRQERQEFGRFYYRFPNGESGSDVYDRIATFIAYMFNIMEHENCVESQDRAENYVLVTHGLLMRFFLMFYLRWTVVEFEEVSMPENAEVWVLEKHPVRGNYELVGRLVQDDKKSEFKDIRFGKAANQPMPEHMRRPLLSRVVVPGTPDSWNSDELSFLSNMPGPSDKDSKTIDDLVANWNEGANFHPSHCGS